MALHTVKAGVLINGATDKSVTRHLARKSNGDLWCVYTRSITGVRQVCCSYSVDGGANWTEEQVTTNPGHSYDTAIAVDSLNNIHIIYRYGAGLLYQKRTDVWQAPELFGEHGADPQAGAAIAIDSNDDIHVGWEGLGWGANPLFGNVQYRKRTSVGWQAPEAVTDANLNQWNVSIAIDSNDDIHLVWNGRSWGASWNFDSIQWRKRTGVGWQAQESVSPAIPHNFDSFSPCVAIDSSDYVHVVWYGKGFGANPAVFNIQWRMRTDAWQARESVTDESDPQGVVTVALDALDDVHVTWRGRGWGVNAANDNIKHRKRTDAWQAVDSITDRAFHQYHPAEIWAMCPTVGGAQTNIPSVGYALVFTGQDAGGYMVEYFASGDLDWPTPAPPAVGSKSAAMAAKLVAAGLI